jgi:DNA-binding MarR family transcriptional regulator
LRHAWFSLNQTFRRRLAHTGVTPDQFTALRTLMEHEPQGLTQSGLNRLIASDPNTIAALVERMESMGWITRIRHEQDRRAYRLRLTPAGRESFTSACVKSPSPCKPKCWRAGRKRSGRNFWKTWPDRGRALLIIMLT